MRIIYFIITSSLMIILMLLIRGIFRKKLSSNVIYTLWIILYLRLLIPFGYWEIPVFGTAAEIIYRPMAVAEQLFDKTKTDAVPIYEEPSKKDVPMMESQPESESVKVYDAVIPNDTVITQEFDFTENAPSKAANEEEHLSLRTIVLSIWFAGSLMVAGYVVLQNHKLRKKVDELDVVGQIDGIDVCISKELKTPCLFGVRDPKILVPEEVLNDPILYKYAIMHELEHYKHKDHLWNLDRIFICIIYWWNPLIWYASKCVAEDAELACDERVLKNKSIEERKNYGYALLQMIENAQNKPMCLATSFSGNKNTAKQRIEAITRKTKTKKYIFVTVVVILIIFTIVGCVYPSEKSYLKTNDWEHSENKEWTIIETEFPYSVQENMKSYAVYCEIYEYGEVVKTEVLGAAEIEDFTGNIKLRHEFSKLEEDDKFSLEIDGFRIEMNSPLSNYPSEGGYAFSTLQSDKKIEVLKEESLILSAELRTENGTIQTYNCLELSKYTEDELKEQFKDNYVVELYRIVFSELPSDELYKKYSREDVNSDWSKLADNWAKAFIDKDVEIITNLATENACQQLIDSAILTEDKTAFGWSSPWPALTEEHYRVAYCNSKGAEILYYAIDSTPHVYVWKEKLEFSAVENETKVYSWTLERFEEITELDDYRKAYPKNQISYTPMDYFSNGLGEVLNKNALLSSSKNYQALFEAGSAALELLNISKDYSLVHYNTEAKGEETNVHIWFLNEDGSTSGTSVTMWQPYGKEGIWIPREIDLSIDEYNEMYAKVQESKVSQNEDVFLREPVANKVCLAVMPDGISKAGGDYRYIIPEDQVKWTDYYKQARSLAVDGAWKNNERSSGIWVVFNDEWTCITEQGMIFDFDKRAEKEQIEDFYALCMGEAIKYGTGTPVNPENFPEIVSATLNYDGAYTVTDENILKDLRKLVFTSEELRGGAACPFTAALVLELKDNGYETIYLATDSCTTWLSDGVYYEYFGYNDFEELYDVFKTYGAKIDSEELILKTENTFSYGIEIIKQAEERLREGYKEAKLTYVDNAEVGWDFYTDNPWNSDEERDAIAQAALKELYTLTGFNVEECTYTTDGRSRFVFGKSASNIKRCIAFYSRDYGFTLCGDSIPYMGFVNARKFHYSDVQQLDSPYGKKEYSGQGAIPMWFLEHSGVYQGEKITGFDAFNLDDTVFTHIKLFFDGGYYVVVMDEKIESFHEAMGPYYE